jgi:hypothetical protein
MRKTGRTGQSSLDYFCSDLVKRLSERIRPMRRQCPVCGREFTGRSDKIYCGSTCRSRNSLAPQEVSAGTDTPVADHPLVVATRRELEAVGRLDTVEGALAIGLASAMVQPRVGSAAMVAASKQLSVAMKAALKGAAPVTAGSKPPVRLVDPVDELTTRRTKRQKAGYSRRRETP